MAKRSRRIQAHLDKRIGKEMRYGQQGKFFFRKPGSQNLHKQ